jgi:pseudouridine synthase
MSPAPGERLRIGKFLARCGQASRRKAEDLVTGGRVTVNGALVTNLAERVDPTRDTVCLDGAPLRLDLGETTLAYFKPLGVLVSRGDPQGRRTIYDELPLRWQHLAPRLLYAGRLDINSEGLLVVTTDGELVHSLTQAALKVEKEYHVRLDRELSEEELERLRAGVLMEGDERPTAACQAWPLGGGRRYAVVLLEGRNRQVRRMVQALGAQVERLRRVRIGGLELGTMAPGDWRELAPGEKALLLAQGEAPRAAASA